jgi:hypothetical protein
MAIESSDADDPAIAAAAGRSRHRIVERHLPFLLPWPRLTLLIRRVLSSPCDEATWLNAKTDLAKALKLRSVVERAGWWNQRALRPSFRRRISQAVIFSSLGLGSFGVRQDAILAGVGAATSVTTEVEPR